MLLGKKEDISFRKRLLSFRLWRLQIGFFICNPLVFSFYTSDNIVGLHIGLLRTVYGRR